MKFLLRLLLLVPLCAFAQAGSLDFTFNPNSPNYAFLPGASGAIYTLASQGNFLLIGGNFSTFGLHPFVKVGRLTEHGVPDGFFNRKGSGVDGIVYSMVTQPDGKILIGGDFRNYNGVPRRHIARLNYDGSLDSSFHLGSGPDRWITVLALQPDGKILVGGWFTSFNGIPRSCLARLNIDGTVDTSFNPGSGADGAILAIALQPDGKIIIGGTFTVYNGIPRRHLARLNPDGDLDLSFDPGTGGDDWIHAVILQPDGKILIGGDFNSYREVSTPHLARLNSDGTLDSSFRVHSGANGPVVALALQPDGKILLGGNFTHYQEVPSGCLARVNPDGRIDETFAAGVGADGWVRALYLQPDGRVVLVGEFVKYQGINQRRITRVLPNGSYDQSFNTGSGANRLIKTIALLSNGKAFVGGEFTEYHSATRKFIARIESDGTLDYSFEPMIGLNNRVEVILVQPDGKILVGGAFSMWKEKLRRGILRFNRDGKEDLSFQTGSGTTIDGNSPGSAQVCTIALQPDGKILIGGEFTAYNGTPRSHVARLNPDGSLDPSFNPGMGANKRVERIVVQPDGKIILVGQFTQYNGILCHRIVRLNANGSLDASFNLEIGVDDRIRAIALQPDGKILIGGAFKKYHNIGRNYLARLNTDGSLDASFDPDQGPNSIVEDIALQPDGKILIAGRFKQYNGVTRPFLARLHSNGALDTSFDPGVGPNGEVFVLALQPDGKILLAGDFTAYGNIPRSYIARINGELSLSTSPIDQNIPFRVYPNPTAEVLWVELPYELMGSRATFRLHNSMGQLILEQPITVAEHTPIRLNLRELGLAEGIYMVSVHTTQGSASRRVQLFR
ncbi:MAG: T9SS type A sorting domain-containing protein [Saprospiraceae bacterium]|nr:T9SS type A sorting domain-containing protein [Saprospiraceae bacterium]MDW8484307.1 T9SS type A sorting domain-containing protein [Saprospiraceae bacterium]